MKINIFKTKGKLILKGLILNESRTFIVGKVQSKFSKDSYISTKWEINKEKKICVCALNDPLYDISLEGVFIPGFIEQKKKNFYTFDKDAWHCKLYKWVYGREPHKVHPTMCPYFWIMVITLFPPVFAIILIIKLFGKTGTAFMEKCSTYQSRRRDRKDEIRRKKRVDWGIKITKVYKSLSVEELRKLLNSQEWDKWHYDLDYSLRDEVNSTIRKWKQQQRILAVEKEHEEWLKSEESLRLKREKRLAREIAKPKRTYEFPTIRKDSKTVKIIGIGLIIIIGAAILWYLTKATVYIFNATDWVFVGKIFMYGFLSVLACIMIYFSITYILIPFYTYIVYPFITKIFFPSLEWFYYKILVPVWKYGIELPFEYLVYKPVKYGVVRPVSAGADKIADIDFGWIETMFEKIGRFFRAIGYCLAFPFILLYKGSLYTVEFFKMCKDLIYSMYKKNCPVITWTEKEESN